MQWSLGCGAQAGAIGACGSIIFGNGKFFANNSGSRSPGRKCPPLGDQESMGCNTHRGVMMKTPPASPFEMPRFKKIWPDFLFQFQIIALNARSHHGAVD